MLHAKLTTRSTLYVDLCSSGRSSEALNGLLVQSGKQVSTNAGAQLALSPELSRSRFLNKKPSVLGGKQDELKARFVGERRVS